MDDLCEVCICVAVFGTRQSNGHRVSPRVDIVSDDRADACHNGCSHTVSDALDFLHRCAVHRAQVWNDTSGACALFYGCKNAYSFACMPTGKFQVVLLILLSRSTTARRLTRSAFFVGATQFIAQNVWWMRIVMLLARMTVRLGIGCVLQLNPWANLRECLVCEPRSDNYHWTQPSPNCHSCLFRWVLLQLLCDELCWCAFPGLCRRIFQCVWIASESHCGRWVHAPCWSCSRVWVERMEQGMKLSSHIICIISANLKHLRHYK